MSDLEISVCTYQNGDFDVILINKDGDEVTLSGNQKLNEDQFEIVNELAPACVFTPYKLDLKNDNS